MNEPEVSRELPGRPFAYYLDVVRRWWYYLVAGLVAGVLGGVALLWLNPPAVTATAVLELDVITSDPFGLDRAPSALLDVGTEQQVARSYLVAERAAGDLDGVLTPAQVLASTSVSVRPQGTVMHIDFTASEVSTARAGADAVASRFLEARGQKVENRINDQLFAIQQRLDELEEEQANLSDEVTTEGELTNLQESRQQAIRNEEQALVQQRTLLNSVAITGGRTLTAGAMGEVTYSPSRSLVLAAGGMAGGLVGLILVFMRQRRPHRVVDVAEVEALTNAPVLPDNDSSGLAAAMLVGMVPEGRPMLLICNMGTQHDAERVSLAVEEVVSLDPARHLDVVLMKGGLKGQDFPLSALREVREAALIANPRKTTAAEIQLTTQLLDLLGVSIIATVWSSSTQRVQVPQQATRATRTHSRKGAV